MGSDDIVLYVELFDEEVECLSLSDPLTGRVEPMAPHYTVYPKTRHMTPRERIVRMMEEIRLELAK